MKINRFSIVVFFSVFFYAITSFLSVPELSAQGGSYEVSIQNAASAAPAVVSKPEDSNEIKLSAPAFNVQFSQRGASLANFNLKSKKYQDNFIYGKSVLETASVDIARPFSIEFNHFEGGTAPVQLSDNNIIYDVKEETPVAGLTKLTFTATMPLGTSSVNITKTYNIDHAMKTVKMTVKIKNNSSSAISLGSANDYGFALNFIANLGENSHDDEYVGNFGGSLYKAVLSSNEYKYDFKPSNPNDVRWMGIRDSYYVSLISFENKKPVSAQAKGAGVGFVDKKGFAGEFKIKFPAFDIEPNESSSFDFFVVMGIKYYDELKKFQRGFEEVCEFNFLALLIMQSLVFFYGLTKNYGLSIILLTIAIKLLLQPLTNKQTKSMKEMQKLQPLINDIKKKYADDMQKVNEEVMKLYKEHGVNPFGGCLPLLLQLPILFALFTALRSSVELKGEGFFWIPDLSLADPTWILPIAIAVSMHIQQSQMQVDPNQAAAFQFMPIFMFFITYQLPAGVLLYWGVSNVLQVVQQWYDNRNGAPQPVIQEADAKESPKKKK